MANSDELITLRFNAIPGNNVSVLDSLNQIKYALEQITKMSKTVNSTSAFAALDAEAKKYQATVQSVQQQQAKGQIISTKNIQNVNSLSQSTNALGVTLQKMTQNKFGKAFDMQTTYGKRGAAEFAASMDRVGYAVMATPKTLSHFITNMRTANSALKDTSKSGIATAESIRAAAGGAPTLVQGLSGMQRVSSMIRLAKSNLDGYTQAWGAAVKEQQWAGRQMIQGISLPLTMLATRAIASWKSIETEILSIKKVTNFKGMGLGDTDVTYKKLRDEINATALAYGASTKAVAHTYQEVVQLGVRGPEQVNAYATSVQNLALLGNMDTDAAFQFFRTTKALFSDKPGTSMIDSIEHTNVVMGQLNAIADNTSVKLADLAAGIPEVAPVMSQMGFSAAATASSLAGMYNRGIPATEAAHGLKFALQRLVNPTRAAKDTIKDLGFSFFDAEGNMSDASAKMFTLASQFAKMNDAQKVATAPELFGSRQAARMNSYFNDLAAGKVELEQLAKGTLTLDQVTSDFLKGMIYSGEIKVKGINVDDPTERYKHAVEMFKKDPTTAIARLKTAVNQVFVQIGANIAPTLVAVGEKLLGFLKKLQDAPPIFYKVALAVGAFAVAMGPLKYASAMAQYSLMSLLKVVTFMIPGITNITNAQALMNTELLATKKVMQLGSKTYMLGGGGGVKNAVYGKLGQFDKINVGGDLSVAQARLASTAATDALFEAEARLTALAPVNIDLQNGQVITNANLIAGRDLLLGTTTGLTTEETLNALALVDEAIALEANSAALLVNAAAREADLVAAESQAAGLATTAASQKGGLISQLAPVAIAKKIGGAVKTGATGAFNGIAGLGSRIASIFSGGLKAAFTSLISGIGSFLSVGVVAFSWIAVIVAAVIAAIFILITLFKGLKSHWGQVMAAMKPGIDGLKAGFERVKEVFSAVMDRFKSIIGQLGTGGSEGQKASSVWEGIGAAAGAVANIIGTALSWLGNLIGWLMPAFELIFYTVKDMVGFVFALFTGDWVNALKYAGAMLYALLGRPVVLVAQFVAGVIARLVDKILGASSAILKAIGLGDAGKALDGWGDSMRNFANNPSWVSDLDKTYRSGLGGVFGKAVNEGANAAKPVAEKAGGDLGADVGEAMNQGVADSASGTSWVETWISKVYGNLDKELEKIKKSAMASLEKANEAAMKVYDARIKAIDDQEKAEEKLLKTQEYIAKRRELLDKKELDNSNYKKARYVAVYEGRYDDARKLDLEHSKTVTENNKSINDLDNERNKDLLKDERATKKDQINLEKETAKEAWDIQKQSLEDHIDLIIKYAPATIGEFQSMMDQINQIVVDNGGELPAVAQDAMDTMLQVFRDSNAQISDEFLRAGKDSRSSWMIGFASANSVAIIATQAGTPTGGPTGGTTGAAGSLASLNPEEKAAFDSFIAHANMPPVPDPTQQQIADWIGSGAGMGSVGASGTTAGMDSIRPEAKSVTANEVDNVITKYSGSAAGYRNENGNKSTYIEREPFHNFGEVFKILALLDKGVSENQIKDKALYLGFTDDTITAALNIYKRGARQATVTSQSVEDSWGKTTTRISTAFGLSEKEISRHGDNINKNFAVYTDKMGSQWKVVNGILQDQFGAAGEFIKNKSGEVTGIQILGTNKVRDVTISNIGEAEDIFKQLTTEGIRPGTAEAEALIQKIKDLGFEILQVNGKTVLINIDLNDPNHVVKTLDAIDTTGANFGETIWINGKPMVYTAVGLAESPDYKQNESGIWVKKAATGGMYNANAGAFKMAMGGAVQYAGGGSLVKNKKDGILANIGEGGYDEYVITTDPKYRAANVGYLAAASAQLGVRAQAGAAIRAAAGYNIGFSGSSGSSGGGGGGGQSGDVYICVETFVGEEAWFNELMKKYDMKITPQERKKIGQQRRTISSYNDRYSIK
jgi:TP901 family phage tail tape measure protein